MIDLLMVTGKTQYMKQPSSSESRAIWFQYFDLVKLRQPFGTSFFFDCMVQPDGYSISLHFTTLDQQQKSHNKHQNMLSKRKEREEELADLSVDEAILTRRA